MRVSRAETTLNYVILLAFAAFALAPVLTILATSVSAPLGESEIGRASCRERV